MNSGILVNIILIKNLIINHGFAFPENQEISKQKKQTINAQCNIVFHFASYTLCSGIQKTGGNSVNHATLCKNLPWNIAQNYFL